LYISVSIASLHNNCHFRNEANYNLLAVDFDFYQEANKKISEILATSFVV